MVTLQETLSSVYGVYRLARLDPSGLAYLDATPRGAARSFHVAVLLLPFFVLVEALRLPDMVPGASLWRVLTVEAIAYVIAWTAFPVAMITLSRAIGRWPRYCAFLSAYNWSSVIQMAVYFPVIVLIEARVLTGDSGAVLSLAAIVVVLAYEWYVIRTSLEVDGWMAGLLVLGDFILAHVIEVFSTVMLLSQA